MREHGGLAASQRPFCYVTLEGFQHRVEVRVFNLESARRGK
jgi:hypothetical protein